MLDLRNLTEYKSPDLGTIVVDGNLYALRKGRSAPSAIIAQSFGADMGPKSINGVLAQTVLAARTVFGELPIFAQTEIASLLPDNVKANSLGEPHVDGSVAFSKHSSREILKMAIREKNEQDIKGDAILLTHTALMHRMSLLWERLSDEKGTLFMPENIGWSYDDAQLWVRGPWQWAARESIGRTLMFIREFLPEEMVKKLPIIKDV